MASTRLTRTPSSVGNRQKWTWSGWLKQTNYGHDRAFFSVYVHANDKLQCYIDASDRVNIWFYNGTSYNIATTRKLRDINAWYHIHIRVDTTQATANDRFRIYVNGSQETNLDTNNQPTQNLQMSVNQAQPHLISSDGQGNNHFDGVMSHINFCDGQSLEPTEFGSTDATTGEWKIKTSPNVTYGTNGFFILKDGNSLTDQSGNSNNFTVDAGTLINTGDNPSNIFCTMNRLVNYQNGSPRFQKGNNNIDGTGTAWMRTVGTLGARTGKFYYEAQINTYYGSGRPIRLGWESIDNINAGATNYYSGLVITSDGNIYGGIRDNSSYDPNTSYGSSYGQGDIIGLAIDLDNDTISVYKNGTVFSNINGFSIASNNNCSIKKSHGYQVSPSMNWYAVNYTDNKVTFNFGNGNFGDTQLTGTTYQDSNGQGVFKYQPPTNYLAWCTKNFNV
tara:strand:+ start:196 stop:1536 length:1341 start_codon:yes stop_codon:yes gene_type:complete